MITEDNNYQEGKVCGNFKIKLLPYIAFSILVQ